MNKIFVVLLMFCGTFANASIAVTDSLDEASVAGSSDGDFFRTSKMILIIEDEPLSAMILNKMLSEYFNDKFGQHTKIKIIENAKDAIKSLDILKPDLIFLDYSGEKSGRDILDYVRNNKTSPVRVITCLPDTKCDFGLSGFDFGLSGFDFGFFIEKPVFKILYSTLDKIYCEFPIEK